MNARWFWLLLLPLSVSANEWSGKASIESRSFSKAPLYTDQVSQYTSAALQLEWFHEWDNGKQSVTFVPFMRVDTHDTARSHNDIRELNWLRVFDTAELRVGIGKVYWGVAESQHLVDVINQTDLVEGSDGEAKLGQAMINLTLINDWGNLDLFVLPGFRERTFPGKRSRLRPQYYIDGSQPVYESAQGSGHIDYALRWFNSVGDWDIGLSYFSGTSRDPYYKGPSLNSSGDLVFVPIYYLMQQAALDIQMTREGWLWKLEAINRHINKTQYIAATAGFEYTFYSVFDSSSDLGLVLEYLYDERGTSITAPFADDIMLGLRWTHNDEYDTSILFAVIADRQQSSRLFSIEGSRRLSDNWKLNIEARLFSNIDSADQLFYSFRNDDYIQLELEYYF